MSVAFGNIKVLISGKLWDFIFFFCNRYIVYNVRVDKSMVKELLGLNALI